LDIPLKEGGPIMFEHLFSHPSVVERHRAAPYAEERERYLTHCAQQGYAHATLRLKARELLWITRKLPLHSELPVTTAQLEAAVSEWHDRQECAGRPLNIRRTRARFMAEARAWLRFLGCWCESKETVPFVKLREEFASWMAAARGLSAATIQCRSRHIDQFLRWYGLRRSSLAEVQLEDIDAFLITCSHQGWARLSVRNMAAALRAFFRYAGTKGWCRSTLAEAIEGPRVFTDTTLPTGPTWKEVQDLLNNLNTDRPGDIRDRAILMLFAFYGWRRGEVAQLQLDHLDWDQNLIWAPRSKTRQTDLYPLIPSVGVAIIRYLQVVRPASTHRELFLTLTPPFRPLSGSALHGLTSKRLQALRIETTHHGPHALRHACAMHLVAEGLSLKEIGDHLGHRSTAATSAYAKVDLAGLREVAAFDLGGLL
jgi:site-specific recombinase XerD